MKAAFAILAVALISYLALWPVPVEPVSWKAPPASGYVGPHAPNTRLADKPLLRKATMRLPRAWWPVPKPYGHVMAFTEDGAVVADLQDPTGAYPETTAVTETPDRLYVQSLHARALGWLPR